MIKVKDGYAKLIGTTYAGSADRVLLSNGGDIGKAVASTANTLVLRNSSGLIESTLAIGTAPFKVISTTLVNNLNSNYLEGLKRRYRIQLDNVTDTGPYCKLMTIKTNSPYIDQPITFKYSLRTSGSGSTHEGYVTIKILGKPVSISVTGDLDHNNRFYLYTISEEVITGDNTTTYIGTHELYFKGGSWTSGDFWDIHWGDATKSIVVHENQKTGLQEPTNYIRVLQSTTGRIGGSVHKVVVTQNNTANAYYPLIWASPADGTTSDSQLFKSYNNLTYNPSTKTVTTFCFKAYNTIGTANFIAEGPQNAWAYISFKSGSSNKYHIATNSNSESGALWLGRRDGGDTGIIIGSSIKLRNNPSGIYYYKSDNSYLGYVGYTDLGLGMTTYNAVSGNTFVLKDAGGILTNTNISATNFVSTVSTGTQPYACSSTTLNTNLNADMLDGVHLAGHGGKEGVMRSWKRGTYTTVNLYFGNGNVVVIDPKPTDDSTLSANTIIFSLGDRDNRNTLLAFMYDRDLIKYRRAVDGPTWGSWRTIAFTDSDLSGTAAYANILKSNSTTSVPTGLLFYAGWLPRGNTNNRSWCSPTGNQTSNSIKGEWGSIVRVNYDNTHYNELFFDANTVRPSWRNVIGTTSTGWKTLGLQEDIRPSGFVTSDVAGLSSYWGKLWEATNTVNYSDVDITFYIHSAYNNKRGFIHIKVRRNPVTTNGVTTYTNNVNMLQIAGNIPTSEVRLYHDADTGKMELWVDVKTLFGVYNAVIISCTTRTTQEIIPILGTLYSKRFTTVLTLPTYSYITLSNLNSNQILVYLHIDNNNEYPLVWSNQTNTNSVAADLLYKSYSQLTYNPKNNRITAGTFRSGSSTFGYGVIELYDKVPYIDFHYNNSTSDYTNRIIEGLSGLLTVTGKFRIGLAHYTSTDYKFYVNGTSYLKGNTRIVGNLEIGANTTRNYIAFRGTTSDGDGAFNHTYIGENIYYDKESSELVLFKGNDNASNAANPNGTGPDRIRYIAAGHLFQIYKSPLSGTFESVCTSTTPINTLAINANDVTSYLNVLPSTNNALNLGSSSLKWANIYATTFTGSLSGNASTATNSDKLDGFHETDFFRFRGDIDTSYVDIDVYTSGDSRFKKINPGTYSIPRSGYSEMLISFAKNTGSTSSLELKTSYEHNNRLFIRKTIDANRISGAWRALAYYDDITEALSKYYWANIKISSASSTSTSPTFAIATATTSVSTPFLSSPGKLTLNATNTGVDLTFNNDDTKSVILNGTHFKPHDAANGKLNLGSSSARWSNVYSYLGNFKNTVHIYASSSGNYTEGIRLYGYSKDSTWSIVNFGCDPAATNGTHANQWLLGRDNNNRFVLRNNATDRLYVLSDGKVGINVVPTLMLHVKGNAMATNLGVNALGGGNGISLYNGVGSVGTYGIAFNQTSNWGTHGYVTGDWATYFTMNNLGDRGWIFRAGSNRFSIDGDGHAYANGLVNANYFVSRVATGTQPYQCTSTTCNTNLNADLLDGLHALDVANYGASLSPYNASSSGWYLFMTVVGTTNDGLVDFTVSAAETGNNMGTADYFHFATRPSSPSRHFTYTHLGANSDYLRNNIYAYTEDNKTYKFYMLYNSVGSWNWFCRIKLISTRGATVTFHSTWQTATPAGTAYQASFSGAVNYASSAGTANNVVVKNSDSNSTYRMVWHSGNTLYGTGGIYCNPSTDCLYASHYYETSDITFKTNIKPISNSDNIPILKSFDWKSDGSHSYGLIALELEDMGYPELVSEGDGYKTVNYSAALSLIVGKLQVKIKELEKEIENLKNKN